MEKKPFSQDRYLNYQKVLIIGDQYVGKSAFVTRIRNNDFDATYVKSKGNLF